MQINAKQSESTVYNVPQEKTAFCFSCQGRKPESIMKVVNGRKRCEPCRKKRNKWIKAKK